MSETQSSKSTLTRLALARYFEALILLAALFFLSAGTLAYWEAWLYLAILFIPMAFVLVYLLKNNPELLERRMRFRERARTQKRLISFSWLWFLLAFLLPGLDFRFGWSDPPVWVVLLAAGLVLVGYAMVFWVFKENSYASRVVEVTQGQQVIDSGPYALVRHPMYIGSILLYVSSPLALGSYWATIPALPIIPILVVRLLDEEKLLVKDLPGYAEYRQKVKYRLLPGIW
jgi:protein-S-isoprenylcysteine O-methyltransferase Ste14